MRCIFRLHFFLYIGSVDPYHRVSCSTQPISIDMGNLCLTAYSTVTTKLSGDIHVLHILLLLLLSEMSTRSIKAKSVD